MKNLFTLQLTTIIFFMFPLSSFACNSLDGIKTTLVNRSESVSYDARSDVRRLGIKIGCKGDTFQADVRTINPEVATVGDNIDISFQYSGDYRREIFDVPCVKTDEERRSLTGTYRLILKPNLLGTPQLIDELIENFGEVSDPNHDSNRFAKLAARAIVTRACGFNIP